jgi:hypothetical protein
MQMQCNGSPSVQMEWSQSSFFFFFIFFSRTYGSPSVYGTRMSRMDRQVSVIFLVSMYECHGWTDKFQLFQFSFSSVAYSQSSLSVRTEVPTKKRKICYNKHRNTDPIGGNIKRDRWHNLMEIHYGRTDSVRPYGTKKNVTNKDNKQKTHRKPWG